MLCVTIACTACATTTTFPLVPAGVNAVAPGAEGVEITKDAAQVEGCTAVGNVQTAGGAGQLQNEGVGLRANVVLVTLYGVVDGRSTMEGVAYKCNRADRLAK